MHREFSVICINLILVSWVIGLQTKRVPREWKVCHRSEKDLERCMKDAGERALRSLAKGSTELGLPSLDPLYVKSIDLAVSQGQQGPFSFKMSLLDMKSTGLSRLKIDKVKFDLKNLVAVINASMAQPQVFEGKYKVNGRVLMLPIVGEGNIRFLFHTYNASAAVQLKRVKRGGIDFANLDKFDFDFKTSKMTMKMDNLFNGNKALEKNLNVFINEHWRELFDEAYPTFKKQVMERIKLYPRRIFEQIPFNDLIPK